MNKQFDEDVNPTSLDYMDQVELALELAKLPPNSKTVKIIDALSLVQEPYQPMQWAVKDILPEGCVLFAGRPKLGKSWLAYHIAISIAEGGRTLGGIRVRQGDVLYLALEDGRQRLQWRLRALLRGHPVPPRLQLAMDWPALDAGGLDEIETWIQRQADARLVIIDPFQRVRPSSSGTSIYSIDFNSLAKLTALTRKYPICIMVVHHTRKANADDAFDTMSGSTGLTGAVDALIVLKRSRGRGDAEIHITGRDIEESTKAMRFEKDTMTWQILGEASEVWQNADRAAIINLLRSAPNGMRGGQIADHLEKKIVPVRIILSRMVRDGQISLIERGLYGVIGGK